MYKYCDENPYHFDTCGIEWDVDNAHKNISKHMRIEIHFNHMFHMIQNLIELNIFEETGVWSEIIFHRNIVLTKKGNSYSISYGEFISIFSAHMFYDMHFNAIGMCIHFTHKYFTSESYCNIWTYSRLCR